MSSSDFVASYSINWLQAQYLINGMYLLLNQANSMWPKAEQSHS